MALDDYDGEIVLTGTWLYDGQAPTSIEVVARNFDAFWESVDYEEPGRELMPLGPEGRLYTVSFSSGRSSGWGPFQTIEALKAWADAQPWGPVTWDDRPDET